LSLRFGYFVGGFVAMSLVATASVRHLEEMMQERGVFVDHATVHRWVVKMMPALTISTSAQREHQSINGVTAFKSATSGAVGGVRRS
jgi:transposase-like protein